MGKEWRAGRWTSIFDHSAMRGAAGKEKEWQNHVWQNHEDEGEYDSATHDSAII
jgi:hypothetical protein